jgi:metal-responsive CopG/Arc/MetJ family transcriptional regulator
MRSTTYNDKTQKVGITLPSSLIKETDQTRGDIKRSTYIRRAVENYVKQGETCMNLKTGITNSPIVVARFQIIYWGSFSQ